MSDDETELAPPHAAATAPSEPEREGLPKAGDVLAGKYEVLRVLGVGGMGVVVAARHVQLEQKVAVKLLLPEARAAEAAARFSREARAALEIKSEHVARVTDFGTLDSGCPFIVMEYLDGSDLKQVARGGVLDVASAVEYVLQACEALAEAHRLGIVHRDLKPANLFLTTRADGTPLIKVLDFGISKAGGSFADLISRGGLTRTNTMLGTPSYMSPEQVRSSKHVDQRSDIWALGVVLYELLTGKLPFDADNITAISAQIVMDTPRALRELRADLPEGLEAAVLRCLEKDPAARYSNVAELAEACAPFAPESAQLSVARISRLVQSDLALGKTELAAESSGASPPPMGGTTAGWGRTQRLPPRRSIVALLGTVATVGILAAGIGWWKSGSNIEKTRREAEATVAASSGGGAAEAASVSGPEVPTGSAATAPSAAVSASSTISADASPSSSVRAASRSGAAVSPRAQHVHSPSEPRCGPGQVVSHGHCCPIGHTWKAGRCQRPLATDVPF